MTGINVIRLTPGSINVVFGIGYSGEISEQEFTGVLSRKLEGKSKFGNVANLVMKQFDAPCENWHIMLKPFDAICKDDFVIFELET